MSKPLSMYELLKSGRRAQMSPVLAGDVGRMRDAVADPRRILIEDVGCLMHSDEAGFHMEPQTERDERFGPDDAALLRALAAKSVPTVANNLSQRIQPSSFTPRFHLIGETFAVVRHDNIGWSSWCREGITLEWAARLFITAFHCSIHTYERDPRSGCTNCGRPKRLHRRAP